MDIRPDGTFLIEVYGFQVSDFLWFTIEYLKIPEIRYHRKHKSGSEMGYTIYSGRFKKGKVIADPLANIL
jgi:hypothetical protein